MRLRNTRDLNSSLHVEVNAMFIITIAHTDVPFDIAQAGEAAALQLMTDPASTVVYWGFPCDEPALRRALGRLIGVRLGDDELTSLLPNVCLTLPGDEPG
jgi:hypothetical protein